ncbi:hypothetical protein MCEMSE6_03048 [Oxalobacteraceae bacterium]
MPSSQALIRYTFYSKTNSDTKMSASITTQVPGKSDSSVIKYLRDKHPDKRQIEITEVIWK